MKKKKRSFLLCVLRAPCLFVRQVCGKIFFGSGLSRLGLNPIKEKEFQGQITKL